MSWYETHVADRIIDWFLSTRAMGRERSQALATANGEVLEIGPGSGNNFRHYPKTTTRLTVLSREPTLRPLAGARATACRMPVEYVSGDAHALPFDNASFDTVVTTFLLCSVREPRLVLRECSRVLRRGGQLLFLEHVHDSAPLRSAVQRCLSPLNRALLGNCTLTRRTDETIREQGFLIEDILRYDVPSLPWPHRFAIRGRARVKLPEWEVQ